MIRNCMTSGFLKLFNKERSEPGEKEEKSTIMSARSAGASRRKLMLTGAGRYPPSVPISEKECPFEKLKLKGE